MHKLRSPGVGAHIALLRWTLNTKDFHSFGRHTPSIFLRERIKIFKNVFFRKAATAKKIARHCSKSFFINFTFAPSETLRTERKLFSMYLVLFSRAVTVLRM